MSMQGFKVERLDLAGMDYVDLCRLAGFGGSFSNN
jgi:hypothetical protein